MYTFFTRGVVPKAAPAAINPDDGDGDSGGDGSAGLGADGGGAGGAGERGQSRSPSRQPPRQDPSRRGHCRLRSSSPAESNVTELMARLQRAESELRRERRINDALLARTETQMVEQATLTAEKVMEALNRRARVAEMLAAEAERDEGWKKVRRGVEKGQIRESSCGELRDGAA